MIVNFLENNRITPAGTCDNKEISETEKKSSISEWLNNAVRCKNFSMKQSMKIIGASGIIVGIALLVASFSNPIFGWVLLAASFALFGIGVFMPAKGPEKEEMPPVEIEPETPNSPEESFNQPMVEINLDSVEKGNRDKFFRLLDTNNGHISSENFVENFHRIFEDNSTKFFALDDLTKNPKYDYIWIEISNADDDVMKRLIEGFKPEVDKNKDARPMNRFYGNKYAYSDEFNSARSNCCATIYLKILDVLPNLATKYPKGAEKWFNLFEELLPTSYVGLRLEILKKFQNKLRHFNENTNLILKKLTAPLLPENVSDTPRPYPEIDNEMEEVSREIRSKIIDNDRKNLNTLRQMSWQSEKNFLEIFRNIIIPDANDLITASFLKDYKSEEKELFKEMVLKNFNEILDMKNSLSFWDDDKDFNELVLTAGADKLAEILESEPEQNRAEAVEMLFKKCYKYLSPSDESMKKSNKDERKNFLKAFSEVQELDEETTELIKSLLKELE